MGASCLAGDRPEPGTEDRKFGTGKCPLELWLAATRAHRSDSDFPVHKSPVSCSSFGRSPEKQDAPVSCRSVSVGAPPAAAGPGDRRTPHLRGDMRPRRVDAAAALALVGRADTFFLATSARPDPAAGPASEGVDMSHRGGRPGFVVATEEDATTVLTWPDYPGNNFFNSLGNLVLHPWAGLLVVDFATGSVLTVRGRAEIVVGRRRRALRACARRPRRARR